MGSPARRLFVGLIISPLFLLMVPLAMASGSDRFRVEFDGVIMDTGEIRGAAFGSAKDDPVATLDLSELDGELSGPAEGFATPDWYSDSGEPSEIGVNMIAVDQIAGAFESASGSLEFTSDFQIEFFRHLDEGNDQRQSCTTAPFSIKFTSQAESGYQGLPAPFVGGVGGSGSVWGAWTSLPDLVGEGWCERDNVDQLLGVGNSGGVMLTRSHVVGLPQPPPDDPEVVPPGQSPLPSNSSLKLRVRELRRNAHQSPRRISAVVANVGEERVNDVRLCAKTKRTAAGPRKRCWSWAKIGAGSKRYAGIRLRPSGRRIQVTFRLTVSGIQVAHKRTAMRKHRGA